MPRAKQRTPKLQNRVLTVAMATLAGDGITAFTTRNLAQRARTSLPAVYELFGDKAGLVREVFFEGFRLLRRRFDGIAPSGDPRQDLLDTLAAFRGFVRDNPVLAEVMFSRPFADFDPQDAEREAGALVREFVVHRVRRCIEAGVIAGNPTDIAHAILALAQGLAAQESASWLSTSTTSRNRR